MKISSAAIAALFLLSACGDQQDGSSPSAATTASSTPTSTRRRFRSPPFARGTPLSDYNFGGGGGVWRARTGVGARGRRIVYMGTDGAWGTSVLLTVSADGSGGAGAHQPDLGGRVVWGPPDFVAGRWNGESRPVDHDLGESSTSRDARGLSAAPA